MLTVRLSESSYSSTLLGTSSSVSSSSSSHCSKGNFEELLALVTHEDSPNDGMTRNDGIDGNLDGNPYASVSSVQIDGKLQRELCASGC